MPYRCKSLADRQATPRLRDMRPSAWRRGYDADWRRISRYHRAMHPLCEDCLAAGRITPSEHVHHAVAKRRGGSDRAGNLMALCWACHSRRTARGE